jgi:hypothetical protein
MASEKKGGNAADRRELARSAEEKQYRIIHTIILGKGDTREQRRSGFVTPSEVGGEAAVRQLVAIGAVADPDAPVRPSEASEERARTALLDIALQGGVITREGEKFRFSERLIAADGLAQIGVTELSAAIVAALANREAA